MSDKVLSEDLSDLALPKCHYTRRVQQLALDMNREQRAAKRFRTLKTLHRARSDPDPGHCCC